MVVVKTGVKGKVSLRCEDCGEIREVQRNVEVMKKEEHPCRPCSNRRNGVLKRGRPSWNSGKLMPEHQRRVGSTYINHSGYVEVYVGKGVSPRYGRKDGYVLEHRKNMQDHLGHEIPKGSIIHHIDGDKTNNDISNLWLCKDNAEHVAIHGGLEELAYQLMELGIIEFHEGEYRMVKNEKGEGII